MAVDYLLAPVWLGSESFVTLRGGEKTVAR